MRKQCSDPVPGFQTTTMHRPLPLLSDDVLLKRRKKIGFLSPRVLCSTPESARSSHTLFKVKSAANSNTLQETERRAVT